MKIRDVIFFWIGVLIYKFSDGNFHPGTWFDDGHELFITVVVSGVWCWIASITRRVSKLEASLAEDEPAEKEAENEEKK